MEDLKFTSKNSKRELKKVVAAKGYSSTKYCTQIAFDASSFFKEAALNGSSKAISESVEDG